jgi:hypothetical protein
MEEFVDAVGRLYDTLSMPDKDKLLLRERKRKQVQEHDFVVSTQKLNFCAAQNQREVEIVGS